MTISSEKLLLRMVFPTTVSISFKLDKEKSAILALTLEYPATQVRALKKGSSLHVTVKSNCPRLGFEKRSAGQYSEPYVTSIAISKTHNVVPPHIELACESASVAQLLATYYVSSETATVEIEQLERSMSVNERLQLRGFLLGGVNLYIYMEKHDKLYHVLNYPPPPGLAVAIATYENREGETSVDECSNPGSLLLLELLMLMKSCIDSDYDVALEIIEALSLYDSLSAVSSGCRKHGLLRGSPLFLIETVSKAYMLTFLLKPENREHMRHQHGDARGFIEHNRKVLNRLLELGSEVLISSLGFGGTIVIENTSY